MMLHEILPHQYENAWKIQDPKPEDYLFDFQNHEVFLKDETSFFQVRDLPHFTITHYLFQIDGTSFFLADLKEVPHTTIPVFKLRFWQPQKLAFACATAWHLAEWYRQNQFCGVCGTKLIDKQDERALVCPNCGEVIYPRINPAVIIGIINQKNQLLITHHEGRPKGFMTLVAGYTEVGETIEETVHREVKEETGLQVKNLKYYRCQPWPFSGSLLFGFWCEVDGDDTFHLDHIELLDAKWTSPEEIEEIEPAISLTMEMIQTFRKQNL